MEKRKKLPKALLNRYKLLRRTKSEKVVFTFAFITFFIYASLIILPIVYLFIMASFASADAYGDYLYMRTTDPSYTVFSIHLSNNFKNYLYIFKMEISPDGNTYHLGDMLFNSLWFCVISSAGGVLMSAFTGYVIAKYKFKGRNLIYSIVIFCMTIPIIGTTGSMLKLVSEGGLNIINTPWFVILTSLGGFGFNFMVLHAFFKNVSWNYVEAVLIDGGGHFTAFFKVVLPQATSSITTLIILALIGTYNDYTTPILYLRSYPTIASGIYELSNDLTKCFEPTGTFAVLLVSIVPIVTLFAIFSDKVMKNFSIGGLKG